MSPAFNKFYVQIVSVQVYCFSAGIMDNICASSL